MAELKTKPTSASVQKFLESISDSEKRADSHTLCTLMSDITGEKPVLWGTAIIGFGSRHYTYATGREGDWPPVGFSPRKQNLTVYIMQGFEKHQDLLQKLGPHSTGVSCLYIKRLKDVDLQILSELIRRAL